MAAGRLVVCPTPIGNLEDVTLRVLAALREADVVACEDTRRTRTLLDRYGVRAPLVSYHEHNEGRRAAELVDRMRGGDVVALVSDAGMPLISDPGYVLVRACAAAGLAERYRGAPPRGEVVLVVGAAERDGGEGEPRPEAVEALRRLVDAGAKPRAAATVVADLTGESANGLYRAHAEGRKQT